MKKIIASTILISAMTVNTFAFDFGTAVSNFFNFNKTKTEVKVETKAEAKSDTNNTETKKENKNSETKVIENKSTNNIETKLKIKSNLSATSTASTSEEICDDKIALEEKANAIKINIKNQSEDRDKIVKSLEKVASKTDANTAISVNEKIIELKSKVNVAIELENELLNKIASSSEKICDTNTETNKENESKTRSTLFGFFKNNTATNTDIEVREKNEIKATEENVSKSLKEAKLYIKVDLKAFLESL